MNFAINSNVLDYEGKPIKAGEASLTWQKVIFQALNSVVPGEAMTAEDKAKAYQITLKAYQSGNPDYTVSERTFIIERVKKVYNPLVVGRAIEFFDKAETAEPST